MSLRRRIVLGLVAIAVTLVATNVALSATFRSFLLGRVDRQLADVAARPFVRERTGFPEAGDDALTEYFLAVGDVRTGTLVQVVSPLVDEDRPPPRLQRDELLRRATASGGPVRPWTVPAVRGGGAWRLVAVADPASARITVVGLDLRELEATLDRLRTVQLLATLAVLLSLGLVSWWVVRVGVQPLEAMAQTADAIAAGDRTRRVEHPDDGTEPSRLATAFNAMLERIEAAFQAREASEARVRRFAADASHELRTPLTSIRGYAELWRAGALRDEAALTDAMRRIEDEATRMGSLVEDLLLLARLDQARRLDQVPVALHAVVTDLVHDARAVDPGRAITLACAPVTVLGDEARLRQVVGNLLANARVHTPPGTPVHVSVGRDGEHAVIEVADVGPGMAPEVAARAFERFYRADDARAGTGTGLGLAIVEAVVGAHGGSVSVETAPGAGSRFLVRLPCVAS